MPQHAAPVANQPLRIKLVRRPPIQPPQQPPQQQGITPSGAASPALMPPSQPGMMPLPQPGMDAALPVPAAWGFMPASQLSQAAGVQQPAARPQRDPALQAEAEHLLRVLEAEDQVLAQLFEDD